MKHSRTISTIVIATVLGTAVLADSQAPTGREQAGRDLYKVLGGDVLVKKTVESLVSIAGRDPSVAPYEGIVRAWLVGSLASSHFGDDMSNYYSRTFTEKELKELTAFLRTPTGQKFVAQLPEAIQRSADLAGVIMETNRKSLEDLLAKRKGTGAKR